MTEQQSVERAKPSSSTVGKWQDYKFGMFIHWGLYAIPGRGEWIMFNDQIDVDEYRKLMFEFRAEAFDASHWTQAAKDAGMKYMVLTSRHHDGFSLFDSKASVGAFTSMHAACKRDIVGEYTEACREAGLGVGLYYSPMDWRFPGYFAPQMYRQSALDMKAQCHGQIRELLSNYGMIDILWYDGGNDFWLDHARDIRFRITDRYTRENPQVPGFWDGPALDEMSRQLQPEIMINERIGAMDRADFFISEGKVGTCDFSRPWESCFTLAGAWGYQAGAKPRPLRECIQTLVQTVVSGGNLLLNVGPQPDGRIDALQVERLEEIGAWLGRYGESIYGTRGGPFPSTEWGGATWRDRTLYVHILHWRERTIRIPRGEGQILAHESLTGSGVTLEVGDDDLSITVPSGDRQAIDTIIRIEFDKPVDIR